MRWLLPLLILMPASQSWAGPAPGRPSVQARPDAAGARLSGRGEWSFQNDIAPILTHAGCNAGSCHGSPAGKGGFRLSLFSRSPERDYVAVAREGGGRRVSPSSPDASLILRKATLRMPHRGGLRLRPGSPEYRRVRAWVAAGAAEGDASLPRVVRLEVRPPEGLLTRRGETRRLQVLARYSDGAAEDVTSLSLFQSNDSGVAEVDSSGLVTAAGDGEAAVMVRYAGAVTAAVVRAAMRPPVRGFPASPQHPVDRHIYARLKALRLRPPPLCSDEEFLRRSYLDLIATLPTAAEARAFLADPAPDRRARLVDALLARPEYADHQALLWADRLRSNSRFHRVGGVRCYQKWLKESFLANMPLDRFARHLLTAKGENYSDGPSNFWGNYDVISRPDEIAPQVSQLFLGVRLNCAECHNHPFERWTQDDFFSLAAVFAQVKGRATKQTQEYELYLDPKSGVQHPSTGQIMPPYALDSPRFSAADGQDVRVPFADWLLAPDNPYFARVMVNRIWRQLMGRGLVEPVDDFRVTNPPTHPELLDDLARELVRQRFDQKAVIRLITGSRTYQASCAADAGSRGDTKFYSRAYPKRLAAEVYYDAICQATGKWAAFTNWPEATRAVQLPENRYPSYFLDTFARGNRLTICERDEEGTVAQALNLINGREIQDKVCAKDGTLGKLLAGGGGDDALLEELFLSTFSRFPRSEERARLARQMRACPTREEGFQDVLWAILCSREFQFNH